jgi:hypothetical protein
LLMVLDRPEIPLHTNGSENDIRCHVTRRKISAGSRRKDVADPRQARATARRSPAMVRWLWYLGPVF